MSLRGRLTVLVSAAVALAVAVAAVLAWALVRSSMLGEIDDRLLSRASQVDSIAALSTRVPADSPNQQRLTFLIQDDPVGLQLTGPGGLVRRQLAFGPLADALASSDWLPPVPSGSESRLDTVSVDDERYRVLTAHAADDDSVLRLFQPLSSVDATLDRVALSLAAVAALGIALAAGLGWWVSRSGLRPVERLVVATESVTQTKDLTRRLVVPPGRRDETGRLADAVNAMLAALEGAQREQRELVENASHELRTPLSVLRNDFGLLARSESGEAGALSPDERLEILGELDAQVTALADSVGEIVDLARGEAEPETPREVDLLDLLDRGVARTRGINPTVTVTVSGPRTSAIVRPGLLESAVANLVRNAVQASPDGGEVTVTLSRDGGDDVVEVCDRGTGLDPAEVPHLFERFFRGAAARSRHGSGLGLAIVAQAAHLHGGTAGAANRDGGGARFTLRWPGTA